MMGSADLCNSGQDGGVTLNDSMKIWEGLQCCKKEMLEHRLFCP